jgi:hypothetical protein
MGRKPQKRNRASGRKAENFQANGKGDFATRPQAKAISREPYTEEFIEDIARDFSISIEHMDQLRTALDDAARWYISTRNVQSRTEQQVEVRNAINRVETLRRQLVNTLRELPELARDRHNADKDRKLSRPNAILTQGGIPSNIWRISSNVRTRNVGIAADFCGYAELANRRLQPLGHSSVEALVRAGVRIQPVSGPLARPKCSREPPAC